MAQKEYIKLDWGWEDGPEAELLRKRHGNKAILGWLRLMILMSEFDGAFNTKNAMQMEHAKRRLRRNEEGVKELLWQCAECGLISPGELRAHGLATSARARRDARARKNRREKKLESMAASQSDGFTSSGTSNGGGRRGGMTPLSDLL